MCPKMREKTEGSHQMSPAEVRRHSPAPPDKNRDGLDLKQWFDSLEFFLKYALKRQNPEQAKLLVNNLLDHLRDSGVEVPPVTSTPYINTIPAEAEPRYPGDRDLERRIKSYIRWNAMAMVVTA